ncbi:hypothetical protein [Brevibacillus laterosporus]|uniref:hypothetical protein n=1 Tax=Brevibacillus laterosporus TaxID=1465 RepID=UPI000EAF301E|nr:hypothetical protein [Brevibacillus laterosporus]AYK05253.1 hypothetical protein D8Z77_01825 [Brevibacillus laterosporus]
MGKFNFKKLSVLAVLSTAAFSMIVTPSFAKVTVTNSTFNEVVVNKATEIEFDNKVNVSKILFNTSDVTVIGLPSTTNIQVGEYVDTEKIGGLSKEQKAKAKRVAPPITNHVVAPVIGKVEKITITSKAKGSVARSVKLDLPNVGGNSYKILKQNQVFDTPNKGTKAPNKAVAYISGNDITDAQANEYIGVYEVDGSDHIVKFVSIQLKAGDIKAAPIAVPAISGHKVEAGNATGTTKVTYTVGNGNSLKYKLADSVITTPKVGEALPGGEQDYISGNDIKATAGKNLGLYEVDGSDHIVKFVSIQLKAGDIKVAPIVAPVISGHKVEAGSASETTKVTYTVGNGNSLKYKLADSVITTPKVGEALPGGEQDYISGNDIKATAGKNLGLYEVDGSNHIVKFISVQLEARDIKAAPIAVPTISGHKVEAGSATGTTKVTYVVGNKNSLKYKLEDNEFTKPNVGDVLSGGTGYITGNDIQATAGQYLGLYEVDGSNNIVKFVSIQLKAGDIKAAPIAVPTISGHNVEAGSATGTTKVTYVVGNKNSLKYKIEDNEFTKPNVGDVLSGGTGYNTGNDIQATTGQYLGLYEVDGSNNIVKFVSIQLKAGDIKAAPIAAPTISGHKVEAGNATGTTKVTYTVGNGNSLKYKLADSVITTPKVGEALSGDEQDYISGNDIKATAGKNLGLYEVDGSNHIVKFISVQLEAQNIKAEPVAAPTISGHKVGAGSATGTTKVTYTVGNGNSLKYKLADSVITTPKVGEALPGGEQDYISGNDIKATAGKNLGLYEVDGSNHIVKFVSVQLEAQNIKAEPVAAPTISGHKVEAGSATGTTKVTYTVGNGNSLKYKLADSVITTPKVGEALSGDEQDYISGNDIKATAGKNLGLYEVDGSNHIVKFISVQLEAQNIKAKPVAAPVISGHKVEAGSASETTKVTYTVGNGNSLKYKLADSEITTPKVGEALPGGEQDYVSGNDIKATAGKNLGLYEVDGSNQIVKFVSIKLESGNISK